MKKTFILLIAIAALCASAACKQISSGDGILSFLTYPEETNLGNFLRPISITSGAAHAFADSGASIPVTCSLLDPNNNGGTLSGTMTHSTSGGIATFNDLSIDKPGNGYRLVFSADGFSNLTSPQFNITPQGGVRLAFATEPTDTKSHGPFDPPVRVRVLDDAGQQVSGGNHKIVIDFYNNPGELIFHASGAAGTQPGSRFLEIIDPNFTDNATGAVKPKAYHWVKFPPMDLPISAMAYDSRTRGLFAATAGASGDLVWIHPPTGRQVLIGYQTLDHVKGLAFDYTSRSSFDNATACLDNETLGGDNCSRQLKNRLVAVLSPSATLPGDHLYEIDQDYGIYKDLGALTVSGGTGVETTAGEINGFFGLASDNQTKKIYAVVDTGNEAGYDLAILDIAGRTLEIICNLGIRVENIAVTKNGDLYAVTGRSASPPRTLYKIDTQTCAVDNGTALPLDNETDQGGGAGEGDNATAAAAEAITAMPAYLTGNISTAVDGIATFPKLEVHAVGSGYRLVAENLNVNCAFSDEFNVTSPHIRNATVGFETTAARAAPRGTTEDNATTITVALSEPQDHAVIVTMAAAQGTARDASSGANADISLFYFEGPTGIGQSLIRNYITEPYYQVEIPAGETSAPFKFETYPNDQASGRDFSIILLNASLATDTGSGIGDNSTLTITLP